MRTAKTRAAIAHLDIDQPLIEISKLRPAHLAGAMDKPLYLLLPFAADFRWLRERTDSPWYPSARLIRQLWFGDWDGAIAALREELMRFPFRQSGQKLSA